MKNRRPLAEADVVAQEIVAWLARSCERIEVAGSVRRRKPEVADIEIICVPKVETTMIDLFGQATDTRNLLDDAISDGMVASVASHMDGIWAGLNPRLMRDALRLRLDKNGGSACGMRYKRLLLGEWPLDLFSVINPAQWGVILALRTGPAEFSRRLVTPESQGGLLPDHMRVRDGALWLAEAVLIAGRDQTPAEYFAGQAMLQDDKPRVMETPEESDFFRAIGVEMLPPEERQ